MDVTSTEDAQAGPGLVHAEPGVLQRAMSATNGNGCDGAAVVDARPVVLVRYRPGLAGPTVRTVHLVPLPVSGQAGAASALCGAVLRPEEIETVHPGQGMPCTPCMISQVAGTIPPPATRPSAAPAPDATGTNERPAAVGVDYRAWGWPVTTRRDQVRLSLERDLVALITPIVLAVQVRAILIRRRCPPPVLAHPYAPEHQVLLAGERYEVALSWPPGVHRVTGALLLPPTMTPRGPIAWVQPPQQDSLRQCREIDVRAAVRAAHSDPPPPC